MNKYLTEFVGAFFLVLVIALSANPIAIGLTLMVMIYLGGHISGGHYNPAVTLAVWMRGAFESKDLVPYWVAQVLGGFTASAMAKYLSGNALHVMPGEGVSIGQALASEILFSFALCAVVLAVATSKKLEGNYVYGWAIGATVIAGAFSVGAISGGAFNPAVGSGPALMDLISGGKDIMMVWLYWVGPFIGAFLAATFFKKVESE